MKILSWKEVTGLGKQLSQASNSYFLTPSWMFFPLDRTVVSPVFLTQETQKSIKLWQARDACLAWKWLSDHMKPERTVERTRTAEPRDAQQQINRLDITSIDEPECLVLTSPAMLHIDACIWLLVPKLTMLRIVMVKMEQHAQIERHLRIKACMMLCGIP